MGRKRGLFLSNKKSSSHSKKKAKKSTCVSVEAPISSDTDSITDNELNTTLPYGSSDTDCATCCRCETISDFASRAGHPKFLTNLTDCIQTGILRADNMSFRLFSELIYSLSSKAFSYSNETMMWWTTGFKMLGGRWLRLMGAPDAHGGKSFACPVETTLRSIVPKSLSKTSTVRKPGMYH